MLGLEKSPSALRQHIGALASEATDSFSSLLEASAVDLQDAKDRTMVTKDGVGQRMLSLEGGGREIPMV